MIPTESKILKIIHEIEAKANAYDNTSQRAKEAHAYCDKYLELSTYWGENVWHVILDDAIRMRENRSKK